MKSKYFKYTLSIGLMIFAVMPIAYAQTETGLNPSFWDDTFGKMVIGGAALVVIAAFFTIINLFNNMMKMQQMQIMKEKGMESESLDPAKTESGFSQLMKKMTNATPLEKEMDILLDHDYDGIGELDNPLPPWWVAMFWITIITAVIYWGYYQTTGAGATQLEEFETEMAMAEEAKNARLASQSTSGGVAVTYLTDAAAIERGQKVYAGKCIACHGSDGGGNAIGPNLADDYWLHGGAIEDIHNTIKNGVIEKGMTAWGGQIGAVDLVKVASYIKSLKGSSPTDPKDPQGELYEEE